VERWERLQALVDAEDLEGLLELVTVQEIAETWCRHTAVPSAEKHVEDNPDWWAVELMMTGAVFQRPELHRELLLALVACADDDVLGVVGAGPLEDFVSDDEDDLRWLERACADNVKLREALRGVWCDGDVSEATMARLDAAAGAPLDRRIPLEQLDPRVRAFAERFDELRSTMPDLERLGEMSAVEERAALAWLSEMTALVREQIDGPP
jgi:hypothetical protein